MFTLLSWQQYSSGLQSPLSGFFFLHWSIVLLFVVVSWPNIIQDRPVYILETNSCKSIILWFSVKLGAILEVRFHITLYFHSTLYSAHNAAKFIFVFCMGEVFFLRSAVFNISSCPFSQEAWKQAHLIHFQFILQTHMALECLGFPQLINKEKYFTLMLEVRADQ